MNVQQTQLYDIYDLYGKPFWQTSIFYVIVAVVALLTALLGMWILVKRYRSRKKIQSPWDQAFCEIRRLQDLQVINKQEAQELYLKLTAIMKLYVQARYGHYTVDKTDDEFFVLLSTIDFPKDLIPGLESLFRGSVEIKFAQGSALATQVERDLAHDW